VVQWSLVPSFAIDRAEVIPGTNPVFGLNALGGAVSLQMKDGFNSPGGSVSVQGGSFGTVGGTRRVRMSKGDFAFYGGASAFYTDGWRSHSPSKVYLGYFDAAARTDKFDGGLSLQLGQSDLTGNGPSPRQLLNEGYDQIFTSPDEPIAKTIV